MYRYFIKNVFDFTIASVLLVLMLPILLLLIILLTIANKGNPFFCQPRPGKKGKIFLLIKFKTMNDKKDSRGILLSDEMRLTCIGQFIRKTSLDELLQFINVVKGDMSIVGPRPLLVEYLKLYNNEQKRRHEVKPGITGWAQVNGRNAITWEKKFKLDVWYVDNISFFLDLQIMFMTFLKVFKFEGINSSTSVTVEKFKGNK